MQANLRFKIVWASLIVGRKFTVFTLYLWAISKYKPPGAYIQRGDLTEGFFVSSLGAYIWRGLYMEGFIFGIFAVKETLLIRDLQPSLNENVNREKLYLF